MKRRDFLFHSAVFGASSLLPNLTWASRDSFSILQGYTTETSTQLTVDVPSDLAVHYELIDAESKRVFSPAQRSTMSFANSPIRVDKLKFQDLALGHNYQFLVKDGQSNKILESRFLRTVDLQNPHAKIAILSCMHDMMPMKHKMWGSVKATDPDYLFFVGDNIYGDLLLKYGPDFLWSRYIVARKNIPFYHWRELKPVIAIWDDHDFGKNNEDGHYKHKEHALSTFKSFFAQDADNLHLFAGPANSICFRAFGQNFLFLDCRYYRGFNSIDNEPGFFGPEQLEQMVDWALPHSTANWMISGSPFFGRKRKSSLESTAPTEFDAVTKAINNWNSPTLFASGDLHHSDISELNTPNLNYQTYELVSSCLHSITAVKFHESNHRRLNGYLKENFLLTEKKGRFSNPAWDVSCVGANANVKFKMSLEL